MSGYYDKQGNPITLQQWSVLLNDPEYQQIDRTIGSGRCVSTIWLGLDHSHGSGGAPIIFETMVFAMAPDGDIDMHELDSERHCTLEEAKAGHAEMAAGHAYVLDKIVRELEKLDNITKLWTIQSEAAYAVLQAGDTLFGEWGLADKDFRESYAWLCGEMEHRGIRLKGRPPIWAWQHPKPDLRGTGFVAKGEKAVRLEIEVPAVDVLASNFEAWHCVLNNHYLISNDDECDKAFSDDGYTRAEIEFSWMRVFDLDYCTSQAGYGHHTQATFPKIEPSYVKKVTSFKGR